MSNQKCCVPGCVNNSGSKDTLHKFPHPIKHREMFNTWVYSVGGPILGLENDHIFKYRRVCHIHFEEKYWCQNNRLSNIAVPTKILPGRDNTILHIFPNPDTSLDHFLTWVNSIGGNIVSLDHHTVYQCRRVCHSHFEAHYYTRSKRLSPNAVPTLHLTGLLDHSYRKDKVHNDHSYVKIGISGMRGTKRRYIPGADKDGGTVRHEVPVADGVHNYTLKDAAEEAPDIAPKEAYKVAPDIAPKEANEVAPDIAPKEANEVAPDIAPKEATEVASENAPEDPDPPDSESGESKAIFSWEAKELLIAADDTEVLQSHQEVRALAALDRDSTETSMYQDDGPFVSEDYSGYDHSYRCNECGGTILGFRYACVQCADWDLCDACEARGEHAMHYVLRIPTQRPYKEIQAVLTTIRQHLLSENHFEPERAHSVKSEPEELQELLESQETQEPQESQETQEPLPEEELGDWEMVFLDSPDIDDVPEVLEENGASRAPPHSQRLHHARPPRRPHPLDACTTPASHVTTPDCSAPILTRLPIQIKRPKIIHETSEVPPISSRSEDKWDPHRTEASPETATGLAPTSIPNIATANNILVRIPAGFGPVGVVKMLNPRGNKLASVRLKPIQERSARVVYKNTKNNKKL